MHLNQIKGSEFLLTKNSVVGILNGKIESIGGIMKAKDMKGDKHGSSRTNTY